MNQNISKILDAIELLREVQDYGLEITSLSHKAKAMFNQETSSEDRGISFVDTLNDEQLKAAIKLKDKRLDLYPHPDPFVVNYLRTSGRGWALFLK